MKTPQNPEVVRFDEGYGIRFCRRSGTILVWVQGLSGRKMKNPTSVHTTRVVFSTQEEAVVETRDIVIPYLLREKGVEQDEIKGWDSKDAETSVTNTDCVPPPYEAALTTEETPFDFGYGVVVAMPPEQAVVLRDDLRRLISCLIAPTGMMDVKACESMDRVTDLIVALDKELSR